MQPGSRELIPLALFLDYKILGWSLCINLEHKEREGNNHLRRLQGPWFNLNLYIYIKTGRHSQLYNSLIN